MRRPTARGPSRVLILSLALSLALPCLGAPTLASAAAEQGPPAAPHAVAPDAPETLRRAWHRCVRQAYSGQPARLDRHAAQRAALQACRAEEDAAVAAALAATPADASAADDGSGRPPASLTSRARAWMAQVAAYVVDPVTAWLGGPSR